MKICKPVQIVLILFLILSCHENENKSYPHPPHPDSIGIGTEEYSQGEKDATEDIEKNDYKIYLVEIPLDSTNFEEMKDHFIKVYNVRLEYFVNDNPYKNGYNNKMKKEIENKLGINIKKEINNYYSFH